MSCPCGRPLMAQTCFLVSPDDIFSLVGVDFKHYDRVCAWRPRYQGPHTARRIWRRD